MRLLTWSVNNLRTAVQMFMKLDTGYFNQIYRHIPNLFFNILQETLCVSAIIPSVTR
jgi:exonuclease III